MIINIASSLQIAAICWQIIWLTGIAMLYQVETKRLNDAEKRNISRFPERFRFQLTKEEYENLKSQIATSSLEDGMGG